MRANGAQSADSGLGLAGRDPLAPRTVGHAFDRPYSRHASATQGAGRR